eukprot:jgi/Phyca11/7949/fgenesh1_pm.PHYCAscaffold_23_\
MMSPAHRVLPALAPVRPNVAKHAAWSTPRGRPGTPKRKTELTTAAAPADDQTQSTSTSVEDALEVLHAVLAAEAQELERMRLAADDQLQSTLKLLQAELARKRLDNGGDGAKTVCGRTTERSKRQVAPRLRHSPFQARSKQPAPVKLHEVQEERAQLQRDYETMREQVIEEKARQVALFRRLEVMRRLHATQLSEAEAALRGSQADVERLQARVAQARVNAVHEARRTSSLVQNLKTERQRLVCALAETRHKFQEKQKLRDKVKDLEVSLRLLQRDRQLSPGELSERKGTLLQSNASAIGFGDVGAADFIEAQGRIQELEALLQLSKERQEQQDALLRVSESALAHLSQERELDALENLSMPSPAAALVLSSLTGETQTEDGVGTDLEKEILRRKSIALSAEVNRYQKIVAQSMEEVRALKESRRRSRSGSVSSSLILSPREIYLLEELAASEREIDAMKAKLKKKCKKDRSNTKHNHEEEGEEREPLDTNEAVKMIQTCSKGFLARREFIRKKLAIGKIKARYRGYLVRKNYEALGGSTYSRQLLPSGLAPQTEPDFLLVTEAIQYKMQIVEPHYRASGICEGGGKGEVDIVLRVSKDPPILQLQVAPGTLSDQEMTVPRLAYFHLFETIALLPYEDEEVVLETSSEKEIARIFASRLLVQHRGSENDYHFFITRPSKQQEGVSANASSPSREPRTLLTELPVQLMETRATSGSSDAFDAALDGTTVFGQEIDLDLLIQEARTNPLGTDNGGQEFDGS